MDKFGDTIDAISLEKIKIINKNTKLVVVIHKAPL